MSKEITEEKEV